MQLCVISPLPATEHLVVDDPMHLILAQEVLRLPEYAHVYHNYSLFGDYIILDNGAYELTGSVPLEDIKKAALIVEPKEIVLPDILRNGLTTVELAKEYSPLLRGFAKDELGYPVRLMFVIQGDTKGGWLWCAEQAIIMYEAELIDCVGIPRAYADDFGSWLDAMYFLTAAPVSRGEIPIHLFGGPTRLDCASEVEQAFPKRVRSTDTAKPIHYAMAGIEWNQQQDLGTQTREDVKRSPDFFTAVLDEVTLQRAAANISLYRSSIGQIPI